MEPDDEDLEPEEGMSRLYPTMRIYVSMVTSEGEQLEVGEFLDFCGEKGIAEQIRDFIDGGICNVYYCNFNQINKIL